MSQNLNELEIHRMYYDQIFEVLAKEPYANFLGIKLQELGEGTATATLEVQNHMLNTHGTVHGAIIFAIADYVFAAASNSYGKTSVGISTTVNFMSAGKKGSQLKATAVEEKRNHRLGWYSIKIESEQELIATMDATVYRKNHYFIPLED
jgi:acyl-CoA thioesterase